MSPIIPFGPERMERATRRPADSVSFNETNSASAVVTGTGVNLIQTVLRNNINGLRLCFLWMLANTNSANVIWRFLRNGERYNDAYGDMPIGGFAGGVTLPIFLVYDAGDELILRVENNAGANRDFAVHIAGWIF